jgi:hypothetical protein
MTIDERIAALVAVAERHHRGIDGYTVWLSAISAEM